MESRIQLLPVGAASAAKVSPAGRIAVAATLALALLAGAPAQAADADDLELEPLVVREPERRAVDVDAIDTENFEIGVLGGLMNVEDFGTNTMQGVRAAYHVTESFFVEASYAQTTLGQTSFERLSGGAELLTPEERDMVTYNVALGWNIFPGEAFVARRWAFKGGVYLLGGAGSTEFGGDDRFTVSAGVGYRFVLADWLALRVDVRDHYFESDLLGEMEGRHNIEMSGGITIFF